MSVSKQILNMFDGQKIKAIAINIKCVEDIDDIRIHLKNKYGEENIQENERAFIVKGKPYLKPWLPRERLGVFGVSGSQYYIEAESRSAVGRIAPRRSFYPLTVLSMKDEKTLISTIDAAQNHIIEYSLQD